MLGCKQKQFEATTEIDPVIVVEAVAAQVMGLKQLQLVNYQHLSCIIVVSNTVAIRNSS